MLPFIVVPIYKLQCTEVENAKRKRKRIWNLRGRFALNIEIMVCISRFNYFPLQFNREEKKRNEKKRKKSDFEALWFESRCILVAMSYKHIPR